MSVFRRSSVSKPSLLGKKRGRAAQHRLSFESLENRTLLTATAPGLGVGVDLGSISYYDTSYMWANVMEQSNDQWMVGQESSTWNITGGVSLPSGIAMPAFDSNGYPIGLGGLAAQNYALYTMIFTNSAAEYPAGTYTLTFAGAGTVRIQNGNQPTQSFTQSGGSGTVFNVNIMDDSRGIIVVITSSDPSNYVRNISLVMPGLQQTYQTNPFNPKFLASLQPFSTIRFLGMMVPDFGSATTSDGQSGPLTWAESTPPTYFTQAVQSGISVEYMVDLCNILHENMWVTMPVNADSEYVTNFAQYVEENLNPNLKVYVEYGNELWNWAYSYSYNYVQAYANANNESHAYATADLTAACWSLWEQVYAGQTNRMVRVVTTQFANPSLLSQELTRLIATSSPTDPDHGFDVVSGAAYFSPDTSSYNASTTVGDIEAGMMADLAGAWRQQLQSFMATVASFEAQLGRPIPVDMYEGGVSLVAPSGASWWNAYIAAQSDSGMYGVINTFLDDLEEAGVAGIEYNEFVGTATQYGEWGTMEYLGEPSSLTPKYNALAGFTNLVLTGGSSTPVTAGTPLQFTVTVYDANDSTIDTSFTGWVQFTSTDLEAQLPATYSFTPGNNGVRTFTVTLKTAGTQSVSVYAQPDGLAVTQSGIVVQPAPIGSLVITQLPSKVYAGLTDGFQVAACDSYGNVITGFTGTVQFTSSDPDADLPSSYTFTSANAGVHLFSAELETPGTQTITATAATVPAITGSASTTVAAVVAQRDTTTQGNWIGTYGSQGYDLFNVVSSLPSYATVTMTGESLWTWASPTTVPEALERPGGTSRTAATAYSATSFTVDVNLTDGKQHNLALYFVDWDAVGRSEQVQLTNAVTGAVLDTETVSSFQNGAYLDWTVSGNVLIKFTRLLGGNAVCSGIFLDPVPGSLVRTDTTTQGNWIGTYGSQGYDIFAEANTFPSDDTVTLTEGGLWTWVSPTTQTRALQRPVGFIRTAAGAVAPSTLTLDVNLADGKWHNLALYFLDFYDSTTTEQVKLINPTTGAVLDTETVSSFYEGVYLVWHVKGNVVIQITCLSGPEAVVNGLFLDPASSP